jgi:hypothetical protein
MVRLLTVVCWVGSLCAVACGGDDRKVTAVPDVDAGTESNGGRYTGGLPGVPKGGSGGSKSTTDGPKVSTDIAADILLSDLDEKEAVDLCKAVVKASEMGFDIERSKRLSCYAYALSYATLDDGTLDEGWCGTQYEYCLMEIKTARSMTCNKDAIVEQFGKCDAEVGDLEDCIEESAAELRRLADGLKCDEASYDALDKYFETPSPAPCRQLWAACPELDLSRTSDMGLAASPSGCDNNCPYANDGLCDDGGSGSKLAACGLGTDCNDCGPR